MLEEKVDKILEEIQALKIHQNTVNTSAKIFRWITGGLLGAILTVASYFFITIQSHETRISNNANRVERAIRHVEGRGHDIMRDQYAELSSAVRELQGKIFGD